MTLRLPLFLTTAILLSGMALRAQATAYLGFEGTGAYLSNKSRLSETGFSNHLGWGARARVRLAFGREERTSLSFGSGYILQQIKGYWENFQSVYKHGILLDIRRHYLMPELMFGLQPFSLRNDRLIISLGGTSLILIDEQQNNSNGSILITRLPKSVHSIFGVRASLSYEKALGRSGIALRTSASYTHFIDDVELAYMPQIGIGIIWKLQARNNRGIF